MLPSVSLPLLQLALSLGLGTPAWPKTSNGADVDPRVLGQLGGWSFFWSRDGTYGIADRIPSECAVDRVNLFMRHTFRGPSSGVGKGLTALTQRLSSLSADELTPEPGHPELDFLRSLGRTNYTVATPELLTQWGVKNAVRLGDGFAKRYHDLVGTNDWFNAFDPAQNAGKVFVRTTDQSRMSVTAASFAQGFLGSDWKARAGFSSVPDSLTTFNTTLAVGTCPFAEKDTGSGGPFDSWNGVYLPPIVARLQKALPRANLTTADVQSMQNICPFDSALRGRLSPFCAIFSLDEWRRYSYGQDLQAYYTSGYGSPLGKAWSVGWVNELIARFTDSPIKDATSTNSTIDSDPAQFPLGLPVYLDFTHDTQILGAMTIMGLLRDAQPLPSKGPVPSNRKWQYSRISPMGAHLVAERLSCAAVSDGGLRGSYVRFLLNDAVLDLGELGPCSKARQGSKAAEAGLCRLEDWVESQAFAQAGGDWKNCYQ